MMSVVIPATIHNNDSSSINENYFHFNLSFHGPPPSALTVPEWWIGRKEGMGGEGGRGGGGGGGSEAGGDDLPWYLHPLWRAMAPLEPDLLTAIGVVMSAVGLAGMTGNLGVLFLLCRCKKLQTTANMYVFNLALADLLMCAGNFPLLIISCFSGTWTTNYSGCKLYGFIGGLTGFVSINTLTAMACDRYNVIYRDKGLLAAGSKNHSLGILISLWIYSFFWAMPPFFGWGRFVLDGGQISCCFDYMDRGASNVSYIVAMFVFCLGIQLLVIMFCYISIVMAVNQHEQSLKRTNIDLLLYHCHSHSYELAVRHQTPHNNTAVTSTAITTTTAAAAAAAAATTTSAASTSAQAPSCTEAESESPPAISRQAPSPFAPTSSNTTTTATAGVRPRNPLAITPFPYAASAATTSSKNLTAEAKVRAAPRAGLEQAKGQGRGKGQGQGREDQDKGQRLGQDRDKGQRQGQDRDKGQRQGQDQEPGQGQGLEKGQRKGQDRGKGPEPPRTLGQGEGQEHEQGQEENERVQGQGHGHGQGQGQGQRQGQGHEQSQEQGEVQEQEEGEGRFRGLEQGQGKEDGQSQRRSRRRRKKIEVQVMRLVCFITISFLVSWTPFAIVSLIGIFGDTSLLTPLVTSLPGLFAKVATVVNPLLYAVGHPQFRQVVLKRYRMARKTGRREVRGVEVNGRATPVPSSRDMLSSVYFATVLGSPDSHRNPTYVALQLKGSFSNNKYPYAV